MEIIKKINKKDYEGLYKQLGEQIKILFEAILKIRNEYYKYSKNDLSRGNTGYKEQLERVFAYELYHQWSLMLRKYNRTIKEKTKRLVLNGEIDKEFDDTKYFPDLILHNGQHDGYRQEIVVEIKREQSIRGRNIIDDLEKLSKLMRPNKLSYNIDGFNNGVFILTDGCVDDIKKQLKKYPTCNVNDNIYCVFCSKKGELQYTTIKEIKLQKMNKNDKKENKESQ